MKKKVIWAFGAIAMLCASCDNEIAEQTFGVDEVGTVRATIKDFEYEGTNFTRTSITVDANGPHYAWAETDIIGIFPSTGRQVEFSMANGAGTTSAVFTGGGWGLKSSATYAAYFPLIGEYYLDKTSIPVDYTGQAQDGNGSTAHLGGYDFLAAPASSVANGAVSFNFERLGALLWVNLTVPEPSTLTSVRFETNGSFTTKGTLDLTAQKMGITPTETSKNLTLGVDITTTESNESVDLYLMVAPTDLTDKTLSAFATTSTGVEIEFTLPVKNFEAGNAYKLQGEDKTKFTSATVAVKPSTDADGTYIIASASNLKWFMENCKWTSEVDYKKASYKLTTDIVFEATGWKPVSFGGVFDGGNHVIENLSPSELNGTYGLFYSISGEVKNLVLKNPTVSQSGDNGYKNLAVGALAGVAEDGAIITNCGIINGSIKGAGTSGATSRIGGLLGCVACSTASGVTIKGCYVNGTTIKVVTNQSDKYKAGGLIGSWGFTSTGASNIYITSCYTKNVTNENSVEKFGTFIGDVYVNGNSNINACYYDNSGIGVYSLTDAYSLLTTETFEALSDANFATAISEMNANLTDCDYIFGADGSFVKKQ